MPDRYDVIVIGAGLSGLLAGAILARRGKRVLLLEQNDDVGGRIRSYDVDKFIVDAGAYLWPNLHLDRALAAAGATDFRGSTIPPLQVMRMFVQSTNGERFSFLWPGRKETPAMLAAAAAGLGADADTFRKLAALWDQLDALSDAAVEALRHVPLRDGLPRFTTDAGVVRAFRRNVMLFGSYDPDEASMAECIGLRRHVFDGATPKPEVAGANAEGGVRALPRAVRAAFEAAGGELRLRHGVDQIIVEDGAVRGVLVRGQLPFQERVEAPVVVSSIPIAQLFSVIAPRHFPPAFVNNAARYAVIGGTISAAFAFDGLPRLRATGEEDTFPGWTRLLIGPEREFGGGLLWATLHSPANAPAGKHVLQAMRLSPRRDIADAARVTYVHDAFRAMLDEIYLDVGQKLLWERRWINRDGSEYMITAAPKPRLQPPSVAGLYLVGESAEGGAVQMDNAALSALRAADAIAAVRSSRSSVRELSSAGGRSPLDGGGLGGRSMPRELIDTDTEEPIILVIDDQEILRTSLIGLLNSCGYRAVGAVDGHDGLTRLRAGLRPCLILLDVRMPRIGGVQFREEQARDARLASIPTVIVSAEPENVRNQFAGVVASLPKPVPIDDLLNVVAQHCS